MAGLALAALTLGIELRWNAPERLVLLPVFVVAAGLVSTAKQDKNRETVFIVLSLTCLCYFLIFLLLRHPLVNQIVTKSCLDFSFELSRLFAKEVRLGPTCLGLSTTLFFLSFSLIALLFTSGMRRRGLLAIFGVVATIQMLALCLRTPAIYPILYGVTFAIVLSKVTVGRPPPSTASVPLLRIVPVFVITVFLVILGSGGALRTHSGQPRPGRVVVYADGVLQWKDRGGTTEGEKEKAARDFPAFGGLSHYLKHLGYSFELCSSPILPSQLDSTRIFMVINPTRMLTQAEREAIWKFVRSGGSLLVLGDHTDIFGIQKPLNFLLEPIGIAFNFDTAYPLGPRMSWQGALNSWPVGFARVAEDKDTRIDVGASLSVPRRAIPVFIGRHSFSDRGDRLNQTHAYLGNKQLDPGEQTCDLVLVALAFSGHGKVLVFGDTTPFQTAVLTQSYGFVANVFNYLSAPDGVPDMARYPIIPAIILVLVFLLPVIVKLKPSMLAVLLFSLAAGAAAFVATPGTQAPDSVSLPSPLASFDMTHGANYGPFGEDDGLDEFFGWLYEKGLPPILSNRQLAEQMKSSHVVFMIAPELPVLKAEVRSMRTFIREGGLVVMSAGADHGYSAQRALLEFQYRIEERPLGNAPDAKAVWTSGPVTFSSAWPVYSIGGEDKVLCTAWGYPVIRYRPIGQGGLLVIGDAGFFFNKNLETSAVPDLHRNKGEMLEFIQELLDRRPKLEDK
ncbi:MAG: DUF4350 domain-containing protein [Candidatus Eisenbacteria bacterium]|nr:DUF4350 domain-containing protein [Candidatus Eisenbacteria bacterium]